jgi:hypothetical protein
MAVFNATARKLGAVEFSTAWSLRVTMYNVAARLAQAQAYQLTQPSAFLGYGQWWNAQFNAPVEKVIIGNPHRTGLCAAGGQPRLARRCSSRDGVETAYVALVRGSRQSCPVARGISPPTRAPERSPDVRPVAIDETPDLYASLASTYAVIGETSAPYSRRSVWSAGPGLGYEQSRFYLGDHPFERFSEPGELADLLGSDDSGRSEENLMTVWAGEWRSRF